MDLYRAEKEAQELQLENQDKEIRFVMNFEGNPIVGVWLDPYLGLFQFFNKDGERIDGFLRVDSLSDHNAEMIVQWVV
jgi:hypothetical protein